MDTSKYIEMCRKAVEVQKLRSCKEVINWQDGDFFTESGNVCSHCVECNEITQCDIWLPRQDQLQDMIDWKQYDISISYCSMPWVFEWQKDPLEINGVNGGSMEQLWLAFVMHELYQKKWDGEAWK